MVGSLLVGNKFVKGYPGGEFATMALRVLKASFPIVLSVPDPLWPSTGNLMQSTWCLRYERHGRGQASEMEIPEF